MTKFGIEAGSAPAAGSIEFSALPAQDISARPSELASGPAPSGITDSNNSMDTATSFDLTQTAIGTVGMLDDTDDWFKITADQTGFLQLDLTGLSTDVDLYLYRAGSDYSFASSTAAGTVSEHIRASVTAGETYYVQVKANTEGVDGTYSLSGSIGDLNDTIDQAQTLACPADTSGTLGGADTHDWYSVTANETGTLSLDLSGLSANADLKLYDANHSLVAASTLTGSQDESLTYSVTSGTQYYVEVVSLDGQATSYDLNTHIADANDSHDSAATLELNTSVSSHVGGGDQADWYQITPDTSGPVTIGLMGDSDDLNLSLYDANGASLGTFTDIIGSGGSVNFDATSGQTYYVQVAPQDSSGSASYTLSTEYSDRNDSRETADILGSSTSIVSHAGGGDDADWYQVTPETSGSMTVLLSGMTDKHGNLDLFLYDSAGTLLQSSTYNHQNDRVNFDATANQSYYVKVAPHDPAVDAATYALTTSLQDGDHRTMDTAEPYTLGTTVSGTVRGMNAHHLYEFTADATGQLKLLGGGSVLDSSGSAVLGQYSDTDHQYLYPVTEGSTYYIDANTGSRFLYDRSYNGYSETSYDYTINATITDGNNNPLDADPLSPSATISSSASVDDRADWYSIEPDDSGTLTVSLSGLSDDATLSLYTTWGTLVASSDYSGGAHEAISTPLNNIGIFNPGYYAVVTYSGNQTDVSYSLTTSQDDGNNNMAEAPALQEAVATAGVMGTGDTGDWYAFTADRSDTLDVSLYNQVNACDLYLHDASGQVVASSTKSGTAPDLASYTVTAGQTYYIEVRADGEKTIEGYSGYDVRVDYADHNETMDTATPIAALSTTSSTVGTQDSADWYEMTADQTGSLQLSFANTYNNPGVAVYDAAGNAIASTYSGSSSSSYDVVAGDNYYVRLTAAPDHNFTEYSLKSVITAASDSSSYVLGTTGNDQFSISASPTSFFKVFAFGGDDVIYGSNSHGRFDGGSGNDTIDYRHNLLDVPVTVNLATGVGNESAGGHDTYVSIENAAGSSCADNLIGNDGANWLYGDYGNDTLEGGAGDDTLIGAQGADWLNGGDGNDWVSYANSDAFANSDEGVSLKLAVRAGWSRPAHGGDAEGDQLKDIENVIGSSHSDNIIGSVWDNEIRGGDGNDSLNGNAGADTLMGGNGEDVLFGGPGEDTLIGGAGADHLNGAAGHNTVSYAGSYEGVSVTLADRGWSAAGVGGDATGDRITKVRDLQGSDHDDTLTGNIGSNILEGGAGDDVLDGGSSGKDTLIGGAGDDTLTGGTGPDSFVFAAGHGDDVITDFGNGKDILDLSATYTDFVTLADVEAHASNATMGGISGLLIETGNGDTIFLQGLDTGDLSGMDIAY